MKPLFYLMRKGLKNFIKDLKKKPAALIGYIFIIAMIVLAILSGSGASDQSRKFLSNNRFGFIVGVVLIGFFYLTVKEGINRGSSFFRKADVNLVFTAPISPKKVLIYGILKQLYMTFVMLFFVVVQIPNIRNWFNIKSCGIGVLVLGSFLFMFIISIIGILIYSIAAKGPKWRTGIKMLMNILGGIFIVFLLIEVLKTKNFILSCENIFGSRYFSYIPIVGWTKEVIMATVVGINSSFYMYLVMDLVAIAIIILAIYNMNTDYYEDVLEATDYKEKLLQNKKEGKSQFSFKKVRKVKQRYRGSAGRAIFSRQMLEYKKTGFFFINIRTVTMIIIGIFFGMSVGEDNILAVLYFCVYMLLFFSLQGKWMSELEKPYIYLIPISSFSKVFYATLADNIKNFIDGFVLFIVVGIKLKTSPIIIVLCALSYASFGTIYTYIDILSRRIFKIESKTLESFLKFIFAFIIVLPGIALSAYFGFKDGLQFGKYLVYISLIIYNCIVSSIILTFNRKIFDNIEMH
ncbi:MULTISPECIES: putative ABC exporter domain-containing protein [Clostridium]|uniref:Membrane protein, putative n=1 Tax=Clostridium novyi (strain NT) TaxID=386415 RepID=A0PY23_CLONN|nr:MULTISPECIES: putative ABC exporter domain-containing protein [Clostridium]ABK61606.1 membrane protein, putative [Clostridium novyi NT]KEH87267.1 membrane protein [Clostridium novyi A str. NCTC 538]KEH90145.1 membrane protein [Clostridium novyi A str. 4540]KEH90784.1 membrane protein [Clostridium novyi A str. BKT29909]KEH92167.1 membrane protein [Clostridium botulinum C/D str. It1]